MARERYGIPLPEDRDVDMTELYPEPKPLVVSADYAEARDKLDEAQLERQLAAVGKELQRREAGKRRADACPKQIGFTRAARRRRERHG